MYLHHLQQYFDLICIINQKSLSIEGISIWGQLQTPALITPKTELIYSYWDSDSLYYSTNINQQYEYVSTACRQLSSFKGDCTPFSFFLVIRCSGRYSWAVATWLETMTLPRHPKTARTLKGWHIRHTGKMSCALAAQMKAHHVLLSGGC